jgi:hypothetical protein
MRLELPLSGVTKTPLERLKRNALSGTIPFFAKR